jgi:hypothetical protein
MINISLPRPSQDRSLCHCNLSIPRTVFLVVLLLHIAKAISMDLYYPEDILTKILESEPCFNDAEQEAKSQVGTLMKSQRLRSNLGPQQYELPTRTSDLSMHYRRRIAKSLLARRTPIGTLLGEGQTNIV